MSLIRLGLAVTIVALCLPAAASSAATLRPLSTAEIRLDGADAGDAAGFSVAGAGDVNGDGRMDVIVGARNADRLIRTDGGVDTGAAYVIFGRPDPAVIDLKSLGNNGFAIYGTRKDDHAGTSVSGARDVNGDGLADVIVGAPRNDAITRFNSGAAYVVFGKKDPAPVELDALGSKGFVIHGAAATIMAGTAVSEARDVNADGRADVAVGAPLAGNNGRATSGSVFVVYGKATTTAVDLNALGTQGYRVDGTAAGDKLGASVSAAGDVNKDGRTDVLVGAPEASPLGRTRAGAAFMVFSPQFPGTIDTASAAFGSPTTGFRVFGATAEDRAGFSVAGFMEVNGDGIQDFGIGAALASPFGRVNAGIVYQLLGSPAPGTIDLSALGARGYSISGAKGDQIGYSLSAPGDTTRDGRAELLAGARTGDQGGNDHGSAYLLNSKKSLTPIDVKTLGTWGFRSDGVAMLDQAGQSVEGTGDVNGDGRPDFIVGASLADNGGRNGSGSAYVMFG